MMQNRFIKVSGGKSALIDIDDTPVFIKRVPLTDLELQSKNFMSTANIFDLPMCYQYGVGSAGFGAWRELATHIITNQWGDCERMRKFPHSVPLADFAQSSKRYESGRVGRHREI
jgi:hypothetical protein